MAKISINQAEAKRVVALSAHLQQVFSAVVAPQATFIRPAMGDHAKLLLASASLRALFFDDTPSPLLLSFLTSHSLSIHIETLQSNLAMPFLSVLELDKQHFSDFHVHALSATADEIEPDKEHEAMFVVQQAISNPSTKYRGLWNRKGLWAPTKNEDVTVHSGVGFSGSGDVVQLIRFKKLTAPLQDWGNVQIGSLRQIPIRRRNLICYTANKLGGVHYDSHRLPVDSLDKSEFKVLAEGYDWEQQSFMHAGLMATALACVEIVRTGALVDLAMALEAFHQRRQERLAK